MPEELTSPPILTDAEKANYILSHIGNTAEELREYFQKLGITGKLIDSRLCPCGTYLRDILKKDILVYKKQIYVYDVSPVLAEPVILSKVSTSLKVAEFVENFDAGKYPELIAQDQI